MQKNNKVILSLTVFSFILFAIAAFAAYPRMVWWVFKVAEGRVVTASAEEIFTHRLFSSLAIAASTLFIGLGAYIISKKRSLRDTVVGWFVLIDVAVLAMIGWLVFLKYRLMKSLSVTQGSEEATTYLLSYQVHDLPLFQLGLAASAAVLLVAWMYPKKPGE